MNEVLGVNTQVGEWVVEMSTAEKCVVVRRQTAAAGSVGRHHVVRSRRTDVRELLVQTLYTVVHSVATLTACKHIRI